MKHLILICGLLLLSLAKSFAQDPVEKTWYNAEKTARIQVYKASDGKFYGKIVWLQHPNDDHGQPRTDSKNPKENLRSKPLLNSLILKSFTRSDEANVYEGGTVYDPNTGKTYCGRLTLNGNELKLKGYICGFSLLGRTSVWTLAP